LSIVVSTARELYYFRIVLKLITSLGGQCMSTVPIPRESLSKKFHKRLFDEPLLDITAKW